MMPQASAMKISTRQNPLDSNNGFLSRTTLVATALTSRNYQLDWILIEHSLCQSKTPDSQAFGDWVQKNLRPQRICIRPLQALKYGAGNFDGHRIYVSFQCLRFNIHPRTFTQNWTFRMTLSKSVFRLMFLCLFLFLTLPAVSLDAQDQVKAAQWVSLFDGKTLDGWKIVGRKDSKWEVKDGIIVSGGQVSMLTSTTGPYKNFRYRAEIKINDGGNSGLYFRAKPEPGFLDGYEAQIDSTHSDPIRTGSIYGMCHVYKQIVKPDTWFTYELEVRDDVWRGREMTRIKVTINGDELYEYMDFEKQFGPGHFAFQQHDPGSIVGIRKIEVMELPSND